MKKFLVFLCAIVLVFATNAMAIPVDISAPYGRLNVDTNDATVVSFYTAQTGTITDLNVQIEFGRVDFVDGVGIATLNSYWRDLDLALEHNGITVQLTQSPRTDGVEGIFNVTFDDDAASPLSYAGPPIYWDTPEDRSGSYQPVGSLSEFNGSDLAGDWVLSLRDETQWADGVTDLLSWSINGTIDTASVPEPATMLLLGSGLIGLAGFRRKFRKA